MGRFRQWFLRFSLLMAVSVVFLHNGELKAETVIKSESVKHESVKNKKVTIILDWFLNASHESLLAAQYSSAFKRHHLDVSLIAPADPGIPPRLVAAGQADMAISYPIQLGMMVDHHLPLVRVGSLINQPLNILITNKNIHSVQALKGRKIGISLAGDEHAILETMLRHVGLSLTDVQIINVNFQLEQALMTGSVDAIIGAGRNYELLDLQQRHFPVNVYKPEDYGVPTYDEMIFITRPELAKDPKIREFMEALKEGTAYLKTHSEEVFQKAIQEHPELNTPLNRAAWEATLSLLPADPAFMDAGRYQKFLDFMADKGVTHRKITLTEFAVQE